MRTNPRRVTFAGGGVGGGGVVGPTSSSSSPSGVSGPGATSPSGWGRFCNSFARSFSIAAREVFKPFMRRALTAAPATTAPRPIPIRTGLAPAAAKAAPPAFFATDFPIAFVMFVTTWEPLSSHKAWLEAGNISPIVEAPEASAC